MLRNEKYMGDAILQKSYTADFLSKKRVMNDGTIPKYYIEGDHEPIIDVNTWNAVQQELARRKKYCEDHFTNNYAVMPDKNPFSGKVVCGKCNNLYSRVSYTTRAGTKMKKWRCGSTNKNSGHRVCTCPYIMESALEKICVMTWNAIVESIGDYETLWNINIESGNELLAYKTRLMKMRAQEGSIKECKPDLLQEVVDHITVFENGDLRILYYDGTEFEVATH